MQDIKCLVLVIGLLGAARAATLVDGRNIYVEVIYDRPEDAPYATKEIDKRNLQENQLLLEQQKNELQSETALKEQEKIQEQIVEEDKDEAAKGSEKPLIDLLACESEKKAVQEEAPAKEQTVQLRSEANVINSLKNLEEKVQLSTEELSQATKHIPGIKNAEVETQDAKIVTPEENIPKNGTSSRPSSALINQVREIIYKGIRNIRNNVEEYASGNQGALVINENTWKDLNASVDSFISSLKDQGGSKQDQAEQNQTFFQTVVTGFQTVGNNFVQLIRPNASSESDEQQPGLGQNVIGFFTGGFQQISNTLSSFGAGQADATVLGDGESSSQPPNPVSGFITQVQNFFANPSQLNPLANTSQSDTGDGATQAPGFFQNAASQIGQVINNFRPSEKPPAEGDEQASTPQQPLQFFQNAASQIGQVINNFRPSEKPATEGDEQASTPQQPLQFFQNAASQIGQVINNFRPTQAPGAEGDEQTTQNQPFQFIQNVFGGLYQPSTKPPSAQGDSSTQAPNPIISGIQGAGSQVQQFFNSSSNPLQGIQGAFGNNSFTPPSLEGIGGQFNNSFTPPSLEGIGGQFSQAVAGITPPSVVQSDDTKVEGGKPVDVPQAEGDKPADSSVSNELVIEQKPVADSIATDKNIKEEKPAADSIPTNENIKEEKPAADSVVLTETAKEEKPAADGIVTSDKIETERPVAAESNAAKV